MANASFEQFSFLGGEISQLAQGRIDREQYRTSLNVCLNSHPIESGALVRRPGAMFAGATRFGRAARVIKFDFEQAAPYTIEATDGFLRFRSGQRWATTNDQQSVVVISAANPAVVLTGTANGWSSTNSIVFSNLGILAPLLQNRQFIMTVVDPTHFSIVDGLTGAPIDGSTLGPLGGGATVSRIQELASPYVGGTWATIKSVQAEATMVLLAPGIPPEILTVPVLPGPGMDAQFALNPLTFDDGPYLDPYTNGARLNPGSTDGIVTLTLTFPPWSATTAYQVGAFVTQGGVIYQSLVDQNVGSTPPSANWQATGAASAINGGKGWLGTDVGRLIRLFSEPPAWNKATTYTTGQVVSYNPSGIPGATTYWQAATGNTNKPPGTDLTNWTLLTTNAAALWTWGKIVSLGSSISVGGGTPFGNMNGLAGRGAAFDGITSQSLIHCAGGVSSNSDIGMNFSSPQAIGSVSVFPSNDAGFLNTGLKGTLTINLYASNTLPASPTNGTLIGTSGVFADRLTAVSIASTSTASWSYVWIQISKVPVVAELQFFGPPSSSGTAISVQILGPPLLYSSTIYTWRLGTFSNTTGWPTCGCYHEGRLWLGGAIPNRFDASTSNGITGTSVNFAPTDQYGTVLASGGISYVLNSDGVNKIQWMMPDLQGIVMGSLGSEWLIEPLAAGAMAPNNIQGRPIPKIGCADISPVRAEHTFIFVHRYRRKLMEGFADVFSGKFSAPNLARWAPHITKPFVAELAYTDAITPTLWGRCDDGTWFGITYKRDKLTTSQEPDYAGFHRHTLGSGQTVTSICGGPSIGGTLDALTLVAFNGATYEVQVIADTLDEGAALLQATYLDDSVNPTSTVSSMTPVAGAPYGGLTINGLWHLNGKTVTAWLAGLDCGDLVVANGSIFVSYGDGISGGTGTGLFTAALFAANPVGLVGFDYLSQGQIVRAASPQESGARSGPAFGKRRRVHYIMAELEGTQGLSFGVILNRLRPCIFRQPNGTNYTVQQTFTGIFRDQFKTGDHDFDGMICWQVNRGYPANLAAVGAALDTADV